jgi:hypothetical protein
MGHGGARSLPARLSGNLAEKSPVAGRICDADGRQIEKKLPGMKQETRSHTLTFDPLSLYMSKLKV